MDKRAFNIQFQIIKEIKKRKNLQVHYILLKYQRNVTNFLLFFMKGDGDGYE